jgi:hypothetical protein
LGGGPEKPSPETDPFISENIPEVQPEPKVEVTTGEDENKVPEKPSEQPGYHFPLSQNTCIII